MRGDLPSRFVALCKRQDLGTKRVAVGLACFGGKKPGRPKHVRPSIRGARCEIRLWRIQAEAARKLDEKDPAVVIVLLLRHRGAAEGNGACGAASASARAIQRRMKHSPPLPKSASPRLVGWLRRVAHSRARYLRNTSSTFACVPAARVKLAHKVCACQHRHPHQTWSSGAG